MTKATQTTQLVKDIPPAAAGDSEPEASDKSEAPKPDAAKPARRGTPGAQASPAPAPASDVPSPDAPAPSASFAPSTSAPSTRSKGNVLAEQIAREAAERRSGKAIEPEVDPSSLEEDWEEVQVAQRPQAPAELQGLYSVRHGTLYFGPHKIVPAGRKVRLDAENAKMFLEAGLVRRLAD